MKLLLHLILAFLAIISLFLPIAAQHVQPDHVHEEPFEQADVFAEEEASEEGAFEEESADHESFGEETGHWVEYEHETVHIVLYVYNTRFHYGDSKLTFSSGERFPQTIHLEEKKHIYKFHLPIEEEGNLRVQYQNQHTDLDIPQNLDGPLYIGMRHPDFFPHDLEIWTQDRILRQGQGFQVRIDGELPIGWATEVSVEVPYLRWPETPYTKEVKLEPARDWKKSKFRLYTSLANSSLIFLKVGDRYFPIIPRDCRCRTRKMYVEFKEEKGQLIIAEVEDGDAGQSFLNQRFGYRGMTEIEYKEWVQSFSSQESGNAFIRQLQQEMMNFGKSDEDIERRMNELIESIFRTPAEVFESRESKQEFLREIREEIQDYGRFEDDLEDGMGELLHVLDIQGDNKWDHAFERAFRQQVDRDNHEDHHLENDILGIAIPGFLISLLIFAFAIISLIRKPQSFFSQHFVKIELILQGFLILLLIEGVLMRNYGFGILSISSVYGWLLFITAIVSFFINVYFLTPDLFGKRKVGRYFLNLGLLCLAILSAVAFHAINPLEDLMFLSIGGDWRIVEWPTNLRRDEIQGFIPLQVMILIFSTIYGIGRNVLLRRLPQLTEKSNALNAELGALKHQISPHFFFNSLNTVYSFSLNENSPKTAEAITKLSDMMRFVIYQGAEERIPLERELNYLEDYIELQRLRLDSNKHQFSFRIDGDPTGLQIAPLVLITLIENAFKHGVSMSQPSFIYISLLIQEGGLILSVENSNHSVKVLAGEGEQVLEGGVGIVNTRQRLDLLYPNRYDWHIQEKDDTYFTQLSIDLD
ncbi:MAG: sensor histidine kinase [Bacteroidota bacterium]